MAPSVAHETYLDPLTHDDSEIDAKRDEWVQEQHDAELEAHAADLWRRTDNGQRDTLHRLECLIKNARRVLRSGAESRYESELKLDLLLTEWGPAYLMKVFARLAENEAREESQS
jgi:hypothetical protein